MVYSNHSVLIQALKLAGSWDRSESNGDVQGKVIWRVWEKELGRWRQVMELDRQNAWDLYHLEKTDSW